MTVSKKITRVHITAATAQALRDILREHRFPVGGQPSHGRGGETGIDAYVDPDQLRVLQSLSVKVVVLADETEVGRARQADVAGDSQYQGPDALPQGLGKLTGGAK